MHDSLFSADRKITKTIDKLSGKSPQYRRSKRSAMQYGKWKSGHIKTFPVAWKIHGEGIAEQFQPAEK